MMRSEMERWLRCALLALLVGSIGATARAQSARAQQFELSWQAPDACPNAAAMRARIAQLLAGGEAEASVVRAAGRIDQHGGRWRLSLALDLDGHHATRELEDADCASLSETAAWLVSVAIDPNVAPPAPIESKARTPPAAPTPEAASPAPAPETPNRATTADDSSAAAAADDTDVSEVPARATQTPLRVRLGLFGGGFAAGFAGLAASAGADVGLELDRVSVGLFGARHFERSRALDAADTQAEFSSLELGLAACVQWGKALRLGPCALVSVVRTLGQTEGVTRGRDADFWWGTAGAAVGARYLVSAPLEIWLDAGLWLPFSARPRFEVEALGTAGEAASLGGRFRLGVGVRLP